MIDKENIGGSFALVESPTSENNEQIKKKLMFDMAFSPGGKKSHRSKKTPLSKHETPMPCKELPMRHALTPRDAEAREYKRHIAALRLQTLLHRRRAQRAFSRSMKLERELRRESEVSTTSSEGQVVIEALRLAQAEKAALEAQLDAERAKLCTDPDLVKKLALVEEELSATKQNTQIKIQNIFKEARKEAQAACEEAQAASQAAQAQVDALEQTTSVQAQFLIEARSVLALTEDRALAAEVAGTAAIQLYHSLNHSLDADRAKWDSVRRKMHNNVVELKGNIRTFVRVRPPLFIEESSLLTYPPSNSTDLIAIPEPIAPGGPPRERRNFTFAVDRVFKPDTDQAQIFNEVDAFIQSAIDGYRVCIFAYGQTGSGKTYTVVGGQDQTQQGILGRSLNMAFDKINELLRLDSRWNFEFKVEAYEIYLDKVYDLLVSDAQRKPLDTASCDKSITIRGLTSALVESSAHAQSILARAAAKRMTNATKSNATSSRSHCVFSLHICGQHPDLPQGRNGLLNLVDLAGSERLKISGSSDNPALLREAQNINTSLSALASTIRALVHKDPHVPFRDSKLTFLLSPCLGGDSKTLAIFNIAPEVHHHRETICTLRFAQQVSKCIPASPQPPTAGISSSASKKARRASCLP